MNFPAGFLDHLEKCEGFNRSDFINAHRNHASVSIRLNLNKKFEHQFKSRVPWTENGYYLDKRPQFYLDPLLHAGAYYVQEASGMFVEYILKHVANLNAPVKILDLCAAPGGKSTIISSTFSPDSLLVSNEVIKSRVPVLKENLIKWGNNNVVITNNDPADFSSLVDFFDIILVDAPCSGSGLFRKDKTAMQEWSMENVLHCQKRQNRILENIVPCLKKDGVLIYTTCSYSKEENEDVINAFIHSDLFSEIKLNISDQFRIIETSPGYRFYPDKLEGEGFYAAVLKKKNDMPVPKIIKNGNKISLREEITSAQKNIISQKIKNIEELEFIPFNENILAFPKQHAKAIKQLEQFLYIKHTGTEIGKIIRDELIPSHELALSNLLKDDTPAIELNLENAIRYLRKEDIEVETKYKGWTLVSYQNIHLGWIKALQNRVNNYYPIDWRIKKA